MTTQKIKTIIAATNFQLPAIDIDTRTNIIDIKANVYSYWGNKYADDGSSFENSAIALQFTNSMVEKPFWIVFFHGAQYREKETQFVSAFWNLPDLSDTIYKEHGVSMEDTEDGVETIVNIVEKFDLLWFSGDEASEDSYPLVDDDSDLVRDLAEAISNHTNLVVNIDKPLEQVDESNIKALTKALSQARESFQERKGKELLVEMLKDEACPEMFKSFVEVNNITSVSYDFHQVSTDYMPDSGDLIVLHGSYETDEKITMAYSWAFTMSCSETFEEFNNYNEALYISEGDFVGQISSEEMFMDEDKWDDSDSKDSDTNKAISCFEFVQSYYPKIQKVFNI